MKRDEPLLYKCQSKPACGVFLHALSFVVHNHQTFCDWHRLNVCRDIPPDAAIKRGEVIYFIRHFLSGSTMSDVFWFTWGGLFLYNTPLSLSQWIIHVSHYLNKPHKFFVFYLHFFFFFKLESHLIWALLKLLPPCSREITSPHQQRHECEAKKAEQASQLLF